MFKYLTTELRKIPMLFMIFLMVIVGCLPTSALMTCGVPDTFSGNVPLYDKPHGKVIDVILINSETRSNNYLLTVVLEIEAEILNWSSVTSRKNKRIIGYLSPDDAPPKCYGGF